MATKRNILFGMARVALYFVTDRGTIVSSTGKLYLLKDAEVFPLAKNLVPPVARTLIELNKTTHHEVGSKRLFHR